MSAFANLPETADDLFRLPFLKPDTRRKRPLFPSKMNGRRVSSNFSGLPRQAAFGHNLPSLRSFMESLWLSAGPLPRNVIFALEA